MRLVLQRQIQLAFLFALVLLLTVGFFAYKGANSLRESLKWEQHTQQVLLKLNDTLAAATDAETGVRGFVITGDEVFLDQYQGVDRKIQANVNDLRELTSDNGNQAAEIANLENLLNEKVTVLQTVVAVRRQNSFEATREKVTTGKGKQVMDAVRASVDKIKSEENRLLKIREDDLDKSVGNILFFLFFGTLAGVVSLALANWAIFREVGKRTGAEGDLRELNKNLEQRVEERTRELSEKNDELGEQIKGRELAETRRRIALEAGNLGTWTLEPETGRAEIDERSLSLFGLTNQEFDGTGEQAFSRIHAEDFPAVDASFRKSFDEKKNFDAEFRVLLPDGTVRWNNCIGQPQFDEAGAITHVVGHCRDVTDIKERELLLRESEHFNRSILNSLSAHIAVLDRDGTITAVNEAWQNFASSNGVEDQIDQTGIGQNYIAVCERAATFQADTKQILDNLRAVLDGESTSFAFEYPCHSPTEERWFILQVSALQGARGGAVISHINITDRKRAENDLKISEQFNRSIFENSPDCIHILELDGTIHSINDNGLELMEIDERGDYVGRQWIDFWEDDEENEQAYQAIKTAARGGSAEIEGFRRTARGRLKYWHASVAPIFDAGGKPSRLVSTSRDITERREAEREREELLKREQFARKDAEIANRMRDEFLATVSHELRAPLNSILGWGRLLEKGNLDEATAAKAVHTIVRNAESQNRLIEDLLDVSRIISGKLRLEVMTVKPINVVESALETVRPAAEAKNITLEIKENPDVSHISGDPNRLQQVVWNLMSNAIKFTPNDGRVRLEIERIDDFVEIRVKDTGVGIKEEFLPHVFDRFRQADASSIRKFGGLGLGLAIVRHITEMHGGTVEVESAGENRGSTFTVRLPLAAALKDEEESELRQTNGGGENPGGARKLSLDGLLILVVDDEEDTRQLLVQALTFHGATVVTANSAEEGLQAVEDKNPDVLVSDIGMPGEDGYSLIRKVRALDDERNKNIPAIALTAFTRAQDRVRALTSGYQNHVAKPVEPDELATVIASLTGRLQMEDE